MLVVVLPVETTRWTDGWRVGVNNNSVSDDAPLAIKVETVIRARSYRCCSERRLASLVFVCYKQRIS